MMTTIDIHACNGKWMVWNEEVCRLLLSEYRIVGEWSVGQQLQTPSHTGSTSTTDHGGDSSSQSISAVASTSAVPSSAATKPSDIESGFEVGLFPMYLQSSEVLFLFFHPSARSRLRIHESGSIVATRSARRRPPQHGSEGWKEWIGQKIKQMRREVHAHDRMQAEMKRKMMMQQKTHQQAQKTEAMQEEEDTKVGAEPSDEPPSKRQATESNVVTKVEDEDDSAFSIPDAIQRVVDGISILPPTSTYNVALAAFPVLQTESESSATECPTPVAQKQKDKPAFGPSMNLTLMVTERKELTTPEKNVSLAVSTRLNQVQLETPLSYQPFGDMEEADARTVDWQGMEKLLYEGICSSLGLRLHDESCSHATPTISSSSSLSSFMPHFSSSSSFSALHSFLRVYTVFRTLWHDEQFFMLPAMHFGADWSCYERAPKFVHSSYLVKVERYDPGEEEARAMDETMKLSGEREREKVAHLVSLGRLAGGVNKLVRYMEVEEPTLCNEHEQTRPVEVDTEGGSTSQSAPADQLPQPFCPCVASFRRLVLQYHHAHIRSSTHDRRSVEAVLNGERPVITDEYEKHEPSDPLLMVNK